MTILRFSLYWLDLFLLWLFSFRFANYSAVFTMFAQFSQDGCPTNVKPSMSNWCYLLEI